MGNLAKWMTAAGVALAAGAAALTATAFYAMRREGLDGRCDGMPEYEAGDYGLEARPIRLLAPDGVELAAWDVDCKDKKAHLIFLSGIDGPSVSAFFPHAAWLGRHGYASTLVEMRGHNGSGGDRIALGYKEHLDVKAALDHIRESSDLPVVIYGLSMGAASALVSLGEVPGIAGAVSLSAYASWPQVFSERMAIMGYPVWFSMLLRPFLAGYVVSAFGITSLPKTPVHGLRKRAGRPVLLIHSTADTTVPFANFRRLSAASPGVESLVIDGDRHKILSGFLAPEAEPFYTETVLGFLERHFGAGQA